MAKTCNSGPGKVVIHRPGGLLASQLSLCDKFLHQKQKKQAKTVWCMRDGSQRHLEFLSGLFTNIERHALTYNTRYGYVKAVCSG